jgi:hypothetical protein
MKLNGEPTNDPFNKDVNNAESSLSYNSPYDTSVPSAGQVPPIPQPSSSIPGPSYQFPPAPLPTPQQPQNPYQQQQPAQPTPYQQNPYGPAQSEHQLYGPKQPTYAYTDYQAPRQNAFALTSFIIGIGQLMFFWLLIPGPLAVIFGHIAISQIKKNPNQSGMAFALTGLILGYLGVAFFLLLVLAGIADSNYSYDSNSDYSVYGLGN